MRVALLHDDVPATGRPDELDVYVQADSIASALGRLGHSVGRVPFSLDLAEVRQNLARFEPEVVFNLVESVEGRARLSYLAPALLDAMNFPYTGCGPEAVLATSNKLLTKRLLAAHGIPTPAWLPSAAVQPPNLALPGRYIIKLVWEDASVGLDDDAVVEVDRMEDLDRALRRRARRLGGPAFAEAYIAGREFNLSLLAGPDGSQVLPPAEIHFLDYPEDRPRVVGYRAKWDTESFEYHHTPRCFEFPPGDAGLLSELDRLARACWELFGLDGYARVDFRVDQAGRPWVLEINANPCLSPDAGFVAAAAQAGLGFEQVITRILRYARNRRPAEAVCT